jgi:hypothetical protein
VDAVVAKSSFTSSTPAEKVAGTGDLLALPPGDSVIPEPSAPTLKEEVAESGEKRRQSTRKVVPPPFVVTLLHGDILFLSGDDFNVCSLFLSVNQL